MLANRIKKVSEAEILDAAFEYGRAIAKKIKFDVESPAVTAAEQEFHVQIYPLTNGDSLLMEIESQIIEAYASTNENLSLTDNVQKIGADSLLYTIPICDTLSNGAIQFKYALAVRMPKKEVILSIR